VAILFVVGFHLPYYRLWSRAGWIGVDLFFVLSGFLISGLLFQELKDRGSIDIKRFLIRRGLKIYPSFYLLIGMAAVLSVMKHLTSLRTQVFMSAVFLQNYYTGTSYSILAHTWSLAVEEHFYLILPPLLQVIAAIRGTQKPFRQVPALFIVLTLLCLGLRWFTLRSGYEAHMTHLRFDSLFAGVTLGYLYHFKQNIFRKLSGQYAFALAVLFCLPATLLDQQNRFMQTFGLTGLFLGFSFLVAWSVDRTPKTSIGKMAAKFASKIGIYSYSIYLWHMPVSELFISHYGLSGGRFWACVAVVIGIGIAMAQLVEMPYLALREKLFPSLTIGTPMSVGGESVGTSIVPPLPLETVTKVQASPVDVHKG
jgi:peptidoglycan/LPS O-acetylase OafA/YrhL